MKHDFKAIHDTSVVIDGILSWTCAKPSVAIGCG